jgi:glutamine synthetase adenylyltransferase
MGMNTRELLIKELLNKSDANGTLEQTTQLLNSLIQERVSVYHSLSKDYPGAASALAKLAQKANSTASLLAREIKGNPYE